MRWCRYLINYFWVGMFALHTAIRESQTASSAKLSDGDHSIKLRQRDTVARAQDLAIQELLSGLNKTLTCMSIWKPPIVNSTQVWISSFAEEDSTECAEDLDRLRHVNQPSVQAELDNTSVLNWTWWQLHVILETHTSIRQHAGDYSEQLYLWLEMAMIHGKRNSLESWSKSCLVRMANDDWITAIYKMLNAREGRNFRAASVV